jgi:hypothetical protein
MYSESVCQAARGWVDVGSFHKGLVVRFMKFTASVRNILDTSSYVEGLFRKYRLSSKRCIRIHWPCAEILPHFPY